MIAASRAEPTTHLRITAYLLERRHKEIVATRRYKKARLLVMDEIPKAALNVKRDNRQSSCGPFGYGDSKSLDVCGADKYIRLLQELRDILAHSQQLHVFVDRMCGNQTLDH